MNFIYKGGERWIPISNMGSGDEHKKLKIISKHSHRWADVGSDVEAQHLVNVILSKVDL